MATDSAGNRNEAKTTVVIGPSDLPGDRVRQLVGLVFSGEATVGAESTTTTTTAAVVAESGMNVWPLVAGGVAVGVIIGVVASRRRRS